MRVFRNRQAWLQSKNDERLNRVKRTVRHEIETAVQSEKHPVGDRGDYIQHMETDANGHRKWAIFDLYGNCQATRWGLDEAVDDCRQLIETGTISR